MRLLVLFLAVMSVMAQTTVRPTQIKMVPAPPAVRLAAWDINGNLTWLDIGPGIRIVNNTLTADIAVAVPVLVTTRMTQATDGSFQATNGIVVRNGMIQRSPEDYTVIAGVMRPVLPWSASDTVLSITSALMVPATPTP
tara:strand:+ start:427 stop:843 length:417 start_codon:yes stop_codon:yes gene_type:complete